MSLRFLVVFLAFQAGFAMAPRRRVDPVPVFNPKPAPRVLRPGPVLPPQPPVLVEPARAFDPNRRRVPEPQPLPFVVPNPAMADRKPELAADQIDPNPDAPRGFAGKKTKEGNHFQILPN